MDDADRGQHWEEREREHLIKQMQQRQTEVQLVINGRPVCVECGDPLVAERLAAVPCAVRCVPCQQLTEEDGG